MNKFLAAADVSLALMMLQSSGDYLPSEPMTFDYFAIVPGTYGADLQIKFRDLMVAVYNEHYRIFREREPNDLNYITVFETKARFLLPSQFESKPWLNSRCPAWESSNCLLVADEGYQKVAPSEFENYL